MENLAEIMYARWIILCSRLLEGAHSFWSDEQGDVNIVSIVVLIGIAILLAIFFREQIEGLLNSLFDVINGNAESAVSG